MRAPVHSHVDLTPIADRLDVIEGALMLTLKGMLSHNHAVLLGAVDGDPFVDEAGNQEVWSPALATQVQAENTDIEAIIAVLEA